MFKDFLYKLKKDWQTITIYPITDLAIHPNVNYDLYWKTKRSSGPGLSAWQKERADLIAKLVEPEVKILDLGCGDGYLAKYLQDSNDGLTVIGADVSVDAVAAASQLGLETRLVDLNNATDIEQLPAVDYIMALELIEHLPCPEELLQKLKKKAAKGFILSFPNSGYYQHRLRLLFGRFPLQWVVHPGEHLRFWTVRDCIWWVNSQGANLDKLVIYQGLPGLKKIMPSLFGQSIIIKVFFS